MRKNDDKGRMWTRNVVARGVPEGGTDFSGVWCLTNRENDIREFRSDKETIGLMLTYIYSRQKFRGYSCSKDFDNGNFGYWICLSLTIINLCTKSNRPVTLCLL